MLIAHGCLGACAAKRRAVHEDGFQVRTNRQSCLDALGSIHQMLQRMSAAVARRWAFMDGFANVERTDPVTAGMRQVLRLGQAVGRNLELGLDDATSPGVRCRIADAAEERQSVGRQQPLALHRGPLLNAQAHRVDLERVGAAQIVQAVGKAGRQDVRPLFRHQQLATGRPVLAQVRKDHQLEFLGCHAGRAFRSRAL